MDAQKEYEIKDQAIEEMKNFLEKVLREIEHDVVDHMISTMDWDNYPELKEYYQNELKEARKASKAQGLPYSAIKHLMAYVIASKMYTRLT